MKQTLGATVGMGLVMLIHDLGYRWLTATAASAAVLAPTQWIRQLPAKAPLPRFTPPVLLTTALAAAVLTLAAPRSWTATATLTAAGLVAAAAAIRAHLAPQLLAGAAGIAVGVAGIGLGAALLRDNNTLAGSAGIGFGVAGIGFGGAGLCAGAALLRATNTLWRAGRTAPAAWRASASGWRSCVTATPWPARRPS